MKLQKLAAAVALAVACMQPTRRAHTQDISFGYRMPAGFPGDVSRTHPASILPGLINQANPPRLYGDPCVIDGPSASYRGIIASDTGPMVIDGILVRPYPTQQTTGGLTATIGTGSPAVGQPNDFLDDGFIMVKVNNGGQPQKNGAVYVYTAASNGGHVQGGFEAAAGTGLVQVTNAFFNGPPDAGGVTEIAISRARV